MSTGWIARLQVSEPLCLSLLLVLTIFLFSLNWYFLFMSLKFSGIIFSAISNLLLRSSSEILGVSGDSVVKSSPANAGDVDSIPGPGRSPREGNGNPFQYSCLENSMNRGAWWATDHWVTKSRTRHSY